MGIPPQGFSVGPLELRFYAVMIMSGLVAGIFLARHEARRRGEDPEHVLDIALWGFLAAIVGARLYHVLDANNIGRYMDQPELIVQIWRGGLGIFGAIVGALVAVLLYTRLRRMPALTWLDIGAPALLLGQAIGRWGNYFNQELFGRPTDLPWGIPISAERVLSEAPQYAGSTHFHPLFLYESILSLVGVVVLLAVARLWRHRLRPGSIFAMYFLWYPGTRFAVEFLRADRWEMGGLPMAQLISLTLMALAVAALIWLYRQPAPAARPGGRAEQRRRARRRNRR